MSLEWILLFIILIHITTLLRKPRQTCVWCNHKVVWDSDHNQYRKPYPAFIWKWKHHTPHCTGNGPHQTEQHK